VGGASVGGAAADVGLRLSGQLNGRSKTLPFTFPTKKAVTSDASTENPRMTIISVNIEAPSVTVGSFSGTGRRKRCTAIAA